MKRVKLTKRIFSGLLAGLLALAVPVSAFEGNPDTAAVFSWLINDYNGQMTNGVPNQIAHDIATLEVTPEGDVFTNVAWDEDGRNFTQYASDGSIAAHGNNCHGWGYEGGNAVAYNSKYVYFAQRVNSEGGGLHDAYPERYPSKEFEWEGIQRRLRSDISVGANFEGGTSKPHAPQDQQQSFMKVFEVVAGSGHVLTGLVATEDRVYASCAGLNQIKVLDAETLQTLAVWEVQDPGKLDMDEEGNLWVVQRNLKKVISLDKGGNERAQKIEFEDKVIPQDICFDTEGNLLVADNGVDEWILVYKDIAENPTFSHTIGEQGGVFSGVPGALGEGKFYQISGLGMDDEGNLTVANSGLLTFNSQIYGNTYIVSYDKNMKERWEARGMGFVDAVVADPQNENILYSRDKRFTMDYTKSPGEEWDYVAYTLNFHKYPDDPRAHGGMLTDFCPSQVIYLQGQKLMVMAERDMCGMAVFRFDEEADGEILIPAMSISNERNDNGVRYPANKPEGMGYALWMDKNGDGQMDSDEFEPATGLDVGSRDWFVDEKGTIWHCADDGTIVSIPFKGFNRYGVPEWDMANKGSETLEIPELKGKAIRRVWYEQTTDEMFMMLLAGGENLIWRSAGTLLAKISNWSKTNQRTLDYLVSVPLGKIHAYTNQQDSAQSLALAGDYIFIGYMSSPQTYILKRDTGELYDMIPLPYEVATDWALVDICTSYRAIQRENGEYNIFIEDDQKSKQWVLRWRDKGGPQNFNENRSLGVSIDNRQLVFPDQEPVNIDGRTMVPMRYIFETLGATVSWDPATRTVTGSIKGGTRRRVNNGETSDGTVIVYPEDKIVTLTIEDNNALVNGEAVDLDVPAQIVNDRTMVPLRVVAEGLGVQVDWYAEENLVNIVTDKSLVKSYEETKVIQ